MNIKIKPEFQNLIPPITTEEAEELEKSILEEAKEWIIRNQLGQRNLSTMDRANLALLLKPIIEEKAKEKEITHTNQGYQKSGNPPLHTDKKLAKAAGERGRSLC
jgi:hypothetical protein